MRPIQANWAKTKTHLAFGRQLSEPRILRVSSVARGLPTRLSPCLSLYYETTSSARRRYTARDYHVRCDTMDFPARGVGKGIS